MYEKFVDFVECISWHNHIA